MDNKQPQIGDKVFFHSNLPVEHHRGLKLEAEVVEVGGRDGMTLTLKINLPMSKGRHLDGTHELVYTNSTEDFVHQIRPLQDKPSETEVKVRGGGMVHHVGPISVEYRMLADKSNGYWSWE